MMRKWLLPAWTLFAIASEASADATQCVQERAAMVETIRAYARTDFEGLERQGISDNVLEAMQQTKRHLFMPQGSCSIAYADRALPIGHGQTISQPFVVALMTHLAEVRPEHTVLEIGTGSGYQAAVLSPLARKVCTVEIVRPLGEQARKVLGELGHANVSVKIGDGYLGWPECGPFDAIIVTAALGHVPPLLVEQLKIGGRIVMPVGSPHGIQQLTVVEKLASGETKTRSVTPVRFVPFTRPGN